MGLEVPLFTFWKYFYKYYWDGDPLDTSKATLHENVHVYSLALAFKLWDLPHYRSGGTFHDDMQRNLRNVSIPGTGLPISWITRFKLVALLFVVFVYPLVALIAALMHHASDGDNKNKREKENKSSCLQNAFHEFLLRPTDWFTFWRMNCRLASWHCYITEDAGYALEDKWKFLEAAKQRGVPVSPWLECRQLVLKHRNEEGGMGIHFYENAAHGGDWIIQQRIDNHADLARMLPANAPLSTFRFITASSPAAENNNSPRSAARSSSSSSSPKTIQTLSCVWRAGRAGASTDHQSVLFDVDLDTATLRAGTTNAHWYQLWSVSAGYTSTHNVCEHPDCGARVSGVSLVAWMDEMRQLVEKSHRTLCAGVPLAGWDVAIAENGQVLLLEVNLSCNFFRGSFSTRNYLEFMRDYIVELEAH